DHALALGHHAGRAAYFAVDEHRTLGGEWIDLARLIGRWMRAELDDDLSRARRGDQPLRSLHHFVERFRRRQTREHHIRLRALIGRRFCRNAADVFELGYGAAPITEHTVAALDQVVRDRQADLADADKSDSFHCCPYATSTD